MSARRLYLALAVGGSISIVLLYLVMVRTAPGQRLDVLALEGRKAADLDARRFATELMGAATWFAAVLVGGLVTFVAHRRAGRAAALATAAAIVGSALCSRAAKTGLPRDALYEHQWVGPSNTFPSGHAAVGATLALLLVVVAPARWRRAVAVVVGGLLGAQCAVLVASGWHRPSDVAGGLALAMLLVGLLGAWHPDLASAPHPPPRPAQVLLDRVGLWMRTAIVAAAAMSLGLLVVRRGEDDLHWFDGFSLAVVGLVVLGLLVTIAFSVAPDLPQPGKSRDSTPRSDDSISAAARR